MNDTPAMDREQVKAFRARCRQVRKEQAREYRANLRAAKRRARAGRRRLALIFGSH